MPEMAVRVLSRHNNDLGNAAFVQQLWAFAPMGHIQIDESAPP
jgi:hypothetical protein